MGRAMKSDFPADIEHTFRIESELGVGGSGSVYKAWHSRLQKFVVIKEVKHSSADGNEIRRNEVEALKNVKNAYLPQVFDFLADDNRSFSVMEFIEGESFDKLLKRGQKYSQAQVRKWYGQLASALEAIHKQNIYHRDIKPANVMLTPGGDVCLIDFNAALVGGNDSKLINRSLGYASPEQYEIFKHYENVCNERKSRNKPAAGENMRDNVKTDFIENDNTTEFSSGACIDDYSGEIAPIWHIDWKRSDIYSLGATMYHLLTGKHPPKHTQETAWVFRHADYEDSIIYIIEKSVSADPAERYKSAEALSAALQTLD